MPIRKPELMAGLYTGLLLATRLYGLADPKLMEQPKNEATPLTTMRLVPLEQLSVPPAGLVPIVIVTTVVLSLVMTWLSEFWTATIGCWDQTTPG